MSAASPRTYQATAPAESRHTGSREAPAVRGRYRLVPAADDLFRVLDHRDRIIGHIAALIDDLGPRYRAQRYNTARGFFVRLGEFWTADDAIDCLRNSR